MLTMLYYHALIPPFSSPHRWLHFYTKFKTYVFGGMLSVSLNMLSPKFELTSSIPIHHVDPRYQHVRHNSNSNVWSDPSPTAEVTQK